MADVVLGDLFAVTSKLSVIDRKDEISFCTLVSTVTSRSSNTPIKRAKSLAMSSARS
jgi:hypothetical protein